MNSAGSRSRKVCCGLRPETTVSAVRISPVASSIPTARPWRVMMRRSSTPQRISPPCSATSATRPRARLPEPPTHIWAFAGEASSAGIAWPKPGCRRSTSRRPLKKSRPARTASCSNSRVTNSSGESADTASRRRPSALRSRSARRRDGSSGGHWDSGMRRCSTIGRNSSVQRRSALASRGENAAKDASVRSRSVHHSSARPSRSSSATLSSGWT